MPKSMLEGRRRTRRLSAEKLPVYPVHPKRRKMGEDLNMKKRSHILLPFHLKKRYF